MRLCNAEINRDYGISKSNEVWWQCLQHVAGLGKFKLERQFKRENLSNYCLLEIELEK